MIYEFGFIGCGNMGGALAFAAAKRTDSSRIALCDHTLSKAQTLAKGSSMAISDIKAIARDSRFIILGVKPQALAECIDSIRNTLKLREDRFIIVTMAAGITIDTVQSMLGFPCPIIRIMPNTPASVGSGMILYCKNPAVPEADMGDFLSGMGAAGHFDELSEKLIDAGSAVSGCGPAFVYMFIEALADGAVAAGLPRSKAITYAAQTVLGSARMVLESGLHPSQLKDAVCSPGGSTIQGVMALENGGLRAAGINAVIRAYERTKELGNA